MCGLLICLQARGETLALRLAYADVPATDLIVEGRFDDAIAVIERRYRADAGQLWRDERATLCGAYVASKRLEEAVAACDDAVAVDASEVAFNNRGVLRMHLGDIAAALEDFARVSVAPEDMDAFLATLAERNVRLVATANMALAQRLAARRAEQRARSTSAQALRGAQIEDLSAPDVKQ